FTESLRAPTRSANLKQDASSRSHCRHHRGGSVAGEAFRLLCRSNERQSRRLLCEGQVPSDARRGRLLQKHCTIGQTTAQIQAGIASAFEEAGSGKPFVE